VCLYIQDQNVTKSCDQNRIGSLLNYIFFKEKGFNFIFRSLLIYKTCKTNLKNRLIYFSRKSIDYRFSTALFNIYSLLTGSSNPYQLKLEKLILKLYSHQNKWHRYFFVYILFLSYLFCILFLIFLKSYFHKFKNKISIIIIIIMFYLFAI